MKGEFLEDKITVKNRRGNIFAKKSGLLLYHLLTRKPTEFRARELARETRLSHGLVQQVVNQLAHSGLVDSTGLRTAKRFTLSKPQQLLQNWSKFYRIMDRCQVYNYSSGYSAEEIAEKLREWRKSQNDDVVLALHAASRAYKCDFTNLNKVEFYCDNQTTHDKLRKVLRLEPVDRGYDVLVIEPYYRSVAIGKSTVIEDLKIAPPLLTFLELYHFPLRGREQAEHLLRRDAHLREFMGVLL